MRRVTDKDIPKLDLLSDSWILIRKTTGEVIGEVPKADKALLKGLNADNVLIKTTHQHLTEVATNRNTFTVTAKNGVTFTVRIVNINDRYGRKMCLTHDGREPLIEFYDAKYNFTEFGQFISRYYLSTLLESSSQGLRLQGGVPAWTLDQATFTRVQRKLSELTK